MRLGIGIGIPPRGGLPSAALTPLLDPYTTGLTGAWSAWQKLLTSYSGSARRLRRSSDSAELDIGFTAANVLDEAAVAAHIGAGSGFDVTLYNQQGTAGRDFAQAAAASQPGYTTIGAQSRPALNFDGTDDVMSAATLFDFIDNNQGYVAAAVLVDLINTDGTGATIYSNDMVFGDNNGDIGLYLRQTGPTYQALNVDVNEDQADVTISTGAILVLDWRHEGGTVYGRLNGGSEASASSGNTAGTSTVRIGQRTAGTGFADLKLTDVIAYDAVPSLATRDAIVAALLARLT